MLFYTCWQLHRASAGPQEEVTYTEKLLRLETFKLNLTFSVPSYCHYTSGLQQGTNVESSLEADRGSFGALAWLFGVLVQPSNLSCLLVTLIVANLTTKPTCSYGMLLPQQFWVFPQWEATCQSKLNSKPYSASDSELTTRDSTKVKQDICFTA